MKSSLETRLGMFFAVVVIAAFILFELLGGSAVFRRGTDYKVQFKSAKDLKVGDPVKLAGVPVGRVKAVQVAGNRVEVTLLVEKSAPIRTDTTASIQFTGLMGQNFVSLTFGAETSPLALSGALLQSREQADLGDLMKRRGTGRNAQPFLVAVDGVTDPGNLGAIIRSADGRSEEHTSELQSH